ncbi:Type 1 phosphatases regulator YPI2 [Spathaspora sp. JA1]|nr:Type 1 phosphatases regulator YPI2 [Spathaspora sp. JA1]
MSNNNSRTELTPVNEQPVLRLRPSVQQSNGETKEGTSSESPKKARKKKKPRVKWTEEVVDNENMNKKKTKICCIFHPNRTFDEEVEHDKHDSGSSSSSSSSDESDFSEGEDGGDNSNEIKPNAYEHQPAYENQSKLPPPSTKN